MALDTSPEHPAPVRQITQAIGQWIDRLGAVWVEGQVTQISRRGGMNTVFLTLRDTNRLNYLHSVFGRTVRGLEVLPRLQQDDAMTVKILRIGAAAQGFRVDAASFAALTAKTKKYSGSPEPGADE